MFGKIKKILFFLFKNNCTKNNKTKFKLIQQKAIITCYEIQKSDCDYFESVYKNQNKY